LQNLGCHRFHFSRENPLLIAKDLQPHNRHFLSLTGQ
jgi:hypothetical protein